MAGPSSTSTLLRWSRSNKILGKRPAIKRMDQRQRQHTNLAEFRTLRQMRGAQPRYPYAADAVLTVRERASRACSELAPTSQSAEQNTDRELYLAMRTPRVRVAAISHVQEYLSVLKARDSTRNVCRITLTDR